MDLVKTLLAGRRGRRFLLEFAVLSDVASSGECGSDSLRPMVMRAGFQLEGPNSGVAVFGPGAEEFLRMNASPEAVAGGISAVQLAEPTIHWLRLCLTASVDAARYWQPPDGEDQLAEHPVVRMALRRVAEHVAGSAAFQDWIAPANPRDQWVVAWQEADGTSVDTGAVDNPKELLDSWRAAVIQAERRSTRRRRFRPGEMVSGEWWSTPPSALHNSTGAFADGHPVGLWCVEDRFGWERGRAVKLEIPPSARIYEIDSAAAWVELCRRYSMLDVSSSKRSDWAETTGRVGDWVQPDWSHVALDYEGVHLGITGYLELAGEVIEVDDRYAGVIAGWDPDRTFWLREGVRPGTDLRLWERTTDDSGLVWVRS